MLNKLEQFSFNHTEQIDRLYEIMTGQGIKEAFDSRGEELRLSFNSLIDNLQSAIDSYSGADNIGMTPISALGKKEDTTDYKTVQEVIEKLIVILKSTLDNSSGADFISATNILGLTGNTIQGILESLKEYVDAYNTNHKKSTSTDHDNRYYSKDEIKSIIDGSSGADNVGVTSIPTLSGNTVQEVLENAKARFDDIEKTNVNVEVSNTHFGKDGKTYETLPKRLDSIDSSLADKANKNICVNVKDFGAKGDGVTNDTTAIQIAINSMTNGGVLFFPIGNYLISSTGAECLLVTKPIKFLGSGAYSRIRVATSTPTTTDVIRISPTTGIGGEGYGFENLQILPDNFYRLVAQGGVETIVPARHAIHLDCTNISQYISKFLLNNCVIRGFNGWGLYLNNPVGNDAFFTSTIMNNLIYNGLYLNRAGDSLNIVFNTITGENTGVYVKSVDGAATNIIAYNNITTRLGAIEVVEALQPKILYNQIEQFAEGGVPQIIIGSGAVNIPLAEIIGNNINAKSTWASNNIKVDRAYRCIIDKNNIFKGTSDSILITANATKTYIGQKNQFEIIGTGEKTPTQSVNDSGNGTIGIEKIPTLNGMWVVDSNFSNPITFKKDEEGFVHLKGCISTTNASDYASGFLLFTLPVSFRPQYATRYMCYNGSSTPGIISISASTGEVRLISVTQTMLTFDGITFKAV